METDLSSVVPRSTSEERDHMADADSKDLDSGRNTPTLATTANDSTNFIQSTIDDLVSTSENDFPATASISRETAGEVVAVPTEKETVIFIKTSNDLPLSSDANVIDPILSEYTESTPVTQPDLSDESDEIQPALSDESESSDGIQPALPDESESSDGIQPTIPDESDSSDGIQSSLPDKSESSEGIQPGLPDKSEEIQPALPTDYASLQVTQLLEETVSSEVIRRGISEEIESTQIIQLPLSKDIEYIQINQPNLDEETKSTKGMKSILSRETERIHTSISEGASSSTVIQPDLSEQTKSEKINPVQSDETESSEVMQSVMSYEVNSNKEISIDSLESRCNKAGLFFSTDSRKDRVSSNKMEPSGNPENASKGVTGIANEDLNLTENVSFPSALDSESFISLLNTEEYKNGTRILFPGSGRVIVIPTKPWDPIFPNFERPSFSPPTKDPSVESNIPLILTKDEVPKRKSSKRSLTALLSMFVEWVQRGLGKNFNSSEKTKIKDFVDNSKKEVKYGLDLLNQMYNHVEKLLRAVSGLPDPTSMLPRELGSERISVRDCLMDAGVDVQRRIQELEAEVAVKYDTFFSIFCNDENLNTEEVENNQLAETAHDIVQNAFVNVSGDLLTLGILVEKYRDKIRDFCLVMDRFL